MIVTPLPLRDGQTAEAVVYVKTLADRCAAAVVRRGVCFIINRKGKGVLWLGVIAAFFLH